MKEKSKTLMEVTRYFSDPQVCINAVSAMHWLDSESPVPTTAARKEKKHYWLATQKRWKCVACRKQFSVKVNSVFEDSPIPLDKWLVALWMLVTCKNGVSSYEIAAHVGVMQRSAWFMLHRLRKALQDESFNKLSGEVEVDESFIGGASRNMHTWKRIQKGITSSGSKDGKVIVQGLLERGGRVKVEVVPNRKRRHFRP